MRTALFVILTLLLIFNASLLLFREPMLLFWINAEAGCYPWSPQEVEYREGMTICPGQRVRVKVPVQIKKDDDPQI